MADFGARLGAGRCRGAAAPVCARPSAGADAVLQCGVRGKFSPRHTGRSTATMAVPEIRSGYSDGSFGATLPAAHSMQRPTRPARYDHRARQVQPRLPAETTTRVGGAGGALVAAAPSRKKNALRADVRSRTRRDLATPPDTTARWLSLIVHKSDANSPPYYRRASRCTVSCLPALMGWQS